MYQTNFKNKIRVNQIKLYCDVANLYYTIIDEFVQLIKKDFNKYS